MATLRLYDDVNEVDFLDTSALYLAQDGWRPRVAAENEAGDDYEDVIEVIKLSWTETTDDVRDSKLQTLHRLNHKAKRYWRLRKTTDAVWLEVQTHSETNIRYARVKEIVVEELDGRHWGPDGPVDLVVTIKREGAYSHIKPTNTTPTVVLNSATIENEEDTSTSNFAIISASDVPGDALALPIIQMVESVAQEQIIIAMRSDENLTNVPKFHQPYQRCGFSKYKQYCF